MNIWTFSNDWLFKWGTYFNLFKIANINLLSIVLWQTDLFCLSVNLTLFHVSNILMLISGISALCKVSVDLETHLLERNSNMTCYSVITLPFFCFISSDHLYSLRVYAISCCSFKLHLFLCYLLPGRREGNTWDKHYILKP
jgi:hypothetical protein